MSYDTDRYKLKKLSSQSLAVVECGIQICHAGHITQKLKYKTYSIHFILEGKGKYTVGGRTYELSAGQGFLITPGSSNFYIADEKEPWKYVYASFTGADGDALVHSAGLDEENVTFSFSLDSEMIRNIYEMHAAGKRNEARGYDVTGYFLLCMSRLIKSNLSNRGNALRQEIYLKKALFYIEDNYSENISVDDVAFHVGLDRTYLFRIFKKYINTSPSRYILDCRLERAAELLTETDAPVSDIGVRVGFHDASHFYKAFISKFGMTPKKYRESKEKD